MSTSGWEISSIAASLANGHGFGNPFGSPSVEVVTGPTTWWAPVYPFLVAIPFYLFGPYEPSAMFSVLFMQAVFSALTAVVIFFLGKKLFGGYAGIFAAWTWAILPLFLTLVEEPGYRVFDAAWSTEYIWETEISALLASLLVLTSLVLVEHPRSLGRWLLAGILCALTALTNPALMPIAMVCAAWTFWRLRSSWRIFMVPALAGGLVAALPIAGWTYRNYLIENRVIPVRGGFGLQLSLNNFPGADATFSEMRMPATYQPEELARYRQLGERAYGDERQISALAFIRNNTAEFTLLSVKRLLVFWTGYPRTESFPDFNFSRLLYLGSSLAGLAGVLLMLVQRHAAAGMLAGVMGLYPVVFYITIAVPRFHYPLVPLILLAAAWIAVWVVKEIPSLSFLRRRVLQCTADLELAQLRATVLRSVGCSVAEPRRKREALELIASKHFDVMVLSHDISTDSAAELCQAFRQFHPKAKIVAITGKDQAFPLPDSIDAEVSALENAESLIAAITSTEQRIGSRGKRMIA